MHNTSEQLEKTLSESVPFSKCELYSERTIDLYKNCVPKVECETNEKATKRLNIPFDEMVYQDLISLNGIKMKIKSDEFSRLVDRSRRKKNDPEPDLLNFVRPTKQEFLFCDLMGKNFETETDALENCQSYCTTIECDDSDLVPNTESDSEKPPVGVEMDLDENLDLDASVIEKCRLLHENYGLDPPQVKPHFEGSSLYKRSHAWKLP